MPSDTAGGGADIGAALERLTKVVEARPAFGLDTAQSVTTVVDGLQCVSEEGSWRLETDLPDSMGGTETAPTPGVLGRAALGSCMAMGYVMRAAVLGVPVTSLRVEVEADFDIQGMLVLDAEAPPGYTEIRVHVEIESSAAEADIRQVLDEGARLDPYLDVFSRAQSVKIRETIHAGDG